MIVDCPDPTNISSALASLFEQGLFLFTGEEMKISDRPTGGSYVENN